MSKEGYLRMSVTAFYRIHLKNDVLVLLIK